MNKTFTKIICIFYCFLIFEGCSVNKNISQNNSITLSKKELVDRINSIEQKDELILIKGSKISIEDNSGITNLKVNFLIKLDSAILVSVSSLLGIEVSRALILKDSIIVIDRINKTYYYEKYDELEKRFSISLDFLQLQSLLTGDFKMNIQESVIPIDRVYVSDKGNINIGISESKTENERIETVLKIDIAKFFINEATILFEKEGLEYQVSYNDYININSYFFPGFLDIEFKNKKSLIRIAIQNKNIKIQPNKGLIIDIPANYIRSR